MIVVIGGPINSGKSTVGRAVAAGLERGAYIEVDRLRDLVPDLSVADCIPLGLEHAALLARNLIRHGFDVVVDFAMRDEDFERFVEHVGACRARIERVTLAPPLEVALCDRGERKLSEEERRRIRILYAWGLPRPSSGRVIDNSDQTPEETAAEILRWLGVSSHGYGSPHPAPRGPAPAAHAALES